MSGSELQNFNIFLNVIQNSLNKFFEHEKEYIKCKEGCDLCCKNADFPFTKIEFDYLLEGFFQLDKELQKKITEKAENIIIEKKKIYKENKKEKFLYDCPLLIDGKCSVYPFRGIICRSFGLISFDPSNDEIAIIPFCAYKGLNYSEVLDAEKKSITKEKFEKSGFKQEPKAFNVKYSKLIKESYGKDFNFEFGEVKPLIEWFEILNSLKFN